MTIPMTTPMTQLSMTQRALTTLVLTLVLIALGPAREARAAKCGGDFQTFLAAAGRDAAAAGVSRGVIDANLSGLAIDQKVLDFDRRQRGTFRKSFEEYVATRVGAARVKRGQQMLAKHAALFARVEQRFGVPKELITAIWGLESDYGAGDLGKMPVVRTLATMAHDCRRTELFQGELTAALKILQRGDMTRETLIGAYAGEIGQTQFLPSSYIKWGVDFDGNGQVDLRRSVPDVVASTANLLKTNGWKTGQPFGEGTENFQVMREWNRSELYRKVMHYFAMQLGAR